MIYKCPFTFISKDDSNISSSSEELKCITVNLRLGQSYFLGTSVTECSCLELCSLMFQFVSLVTQDLTAEFELEFLSRPKFFFRTFFFCRCKAYNTS